MMPRTTALLAVVLLPALMSAGRAQDGGLPALNGLYMPDATPPGAKSEPQRQTAAQKRAAAQGARDDALQKRLDDAYAQPGPAADWLAKPALPASRNPLLGRWRLINDNALPALASMGAAEDCQSLFGGGVIAFTPDALQRVAPPDGNGNGHADTLRRIAYRASGKDVALVPPDAGSAPVLLLGLSGRDHVLAARLHCRLERVSDRIARDSAAPADAASGTTATTDAWLEFLIGAAAPGKFTPFANVQAWVTRDDPGVALLKAAEAKGDPAKQLGIDCRNPTLCLRDWRVMTDGAVASVHTDANGRAVTPHIPAGHYYLVSYAPYQNKTLFWRRAIDLKDGLNSITLDSRNGSLVD
jgi:hypothetical protein